MKLACVIHRFGADIAGGSEGHCRQIAEHLASSHNVTIVTTTAHDHVTWANHYPAGESRLGPLRIVRFPVERRRDLHRFRDISDQVFTNRASAEEEEQWFRENGPYAPALLEYLKQQGTQFDLVLFWSFRYYHAYFGLPLVADRAVLVPTAEEDPVIHLDALDRYFALPRGCLFLTPEEETLVGERVPRSTPRQIVGCGLDEPRAAEAGRVADLEPYILYLGRIDPNKGCDQLIRYFTRWAAAGEQRVNLVLAGPENMPIPDHPQIRRLGFVAADVRDALLQRARVLMMPSPYESLSMVVLEAWNYGTPALVNARCAVLKGQVLRADGGLYYQGAMEFAGALAYLLSHADAAARLGMQGRAYVDREYRWPTVMRKIDALLHEVARVVPVADVRGS